MTKNCYNGRKQAYPTLLNLPVRYAYFMGRPFGFCSP